MYIIEILKVIILGIVQGITEWLPISSTGHLILVEEFIKLNFSKNFVDTFFVVIQLGSILAVVVLFYKKLNPFDSSKTNKEKKETLSLWTKIIVGVIPAGILGILFEDVIDQVFYESNTIIALMLIIYGIMFIIIEGRNSNAKVTEFSQLSYKLALAIGLFQALALIPGTSRSGATIVGAVLLGTSRYIAAEYSFFLATPTMLGASALKLLKAGTSFTGAEWLLIAIGSFVAFIVSVFAIKFLMDYIKKHDFKAFGYYRIILGILVLAYFGVFA